MEKQELYGIAVEVYSAEHFEELRKKLIEIDPNNKEAYESMTISDSSKEYLKWAREQKPDKGAYLDYYIGYVAEGELLGWLDNFEKLKSLMDEGYSVTFCKFDPFKEEEPFNAGEN